MHEPVTHVLVVDDDPDDRLLIGELLTEAGGGRYAVRGAATYQAALDEIQRGHTDVLLVDYHLGERPGTELISELTAAGSRIPAILLTGQGGRQVDLMAMRAGAQDYLDKGQLDADRLERSIRYARERRRLYERLEEAQHMESIGRLAGGIAHDFNNLLTTIQGNAELLLMDAAPDRAGQEELVEIRTAAEEAGALTQQILAYARQQLQQVQPVELNEMLSQLRSGLRLLLGRGVGLRVITGREPVTVLADPVQLRQALVGLAGYARGAMPEGGTLCIEVGRERIEAERELGGQVAPGCYARLRVSDTGAGLDAAALEHIFEPYSYRLGEAAGGGLGLATVQGIVRQSGGVIQARSRPGEGTSFEILLPLLDGAAAPQESAPDAPSCTILLVEDEAAVRTVVGKLLERRGYRVLRAGGAAEGWQLWQAHRASVDVVLLDLMDAEADGWLLAERLRLSDPQVRVVCMSASSEAARVRSVLGEGVTFVAKPFTAESLELRVRELLGRAPTLV